MALEGIVRKIAALVLLIGIAMAVAVQGARFGGAIASSMEMDDLSLAEQQRLMDLGMKMDASARQLLAEDPYKTY